MEAFSRLKIHQNAFADRAGICLNNAGLVCWEGDTSPLNTFSVLIPAALTCAAWY